MSGQLKIHGVDVGPYAAFNGITRLSRAVIGERRLALNGGERYDVTAAKRGWRVKTIVLPAATADALRQLVDGDCDVLSFDLDTWSARGVPASFVSSGAIVSTSAQMIGFPGTKGLYDGGNRLAYAEWAGMLPAGSPWTILSWRLGGPFGSGLVHHYAATSAGLLYRDGVANSTVPSCTSVDANGKLIVNAFDKQENLTTFQATHAYLAGNRISVVTGGDVYIFQVTVPGTSGGSAPSWPTTFNATVSSGSPAVTWRNDGIGGLRVDDLVVMPFAAPASWLSQMKSRHDQFPWVAPEVTLTGSLVMRQVSESTLFGVTARGRFTSGRAVRTKLYGAQGEQVEFDLLEV